jgi:hypothetical protein
MLKKFRFKAGAVFAALLASLVALPAMADDLSTEVVTAITGVNPQITAVIGAMAGAIVLIVAWKLIRKAFN